MLRGDCGRKPVTDTVVEALSQRSCCGVETLGVTVSEGLLSGPHSVILWKTVPSLALAFVVLSLNGQSAIVLSTIYGHTVCKSYSLESLNVRKHIHVGTVQEV